MGLPKSRKFDDIKGVIRSRKSKEDKLYKGQEKRDKKTTIYKTLHRKLMIEQHEHH